MPEGQSQDKSYLVRRLLRAGKNLTPAQVADRLRLSYSDAAAMLRNMEESGYAVRADGAYRWNKKPTKANPTDDFDH